MPASISIHHDSFLSNFIEKGKKTELLKFKRSDANCEILIEIYFGERLK